MSEADMARVKFLVDYRYTPTAERRVSTKFKAGHSYTVKRECADAAIAVGAAIEVDPPTRSTGLAVDTAPGRPAARRGRVRGGSAA